MKNTSEEQFENVRARALSTAHSAEEMLRNSIHALRTSDEILAERVSLGRHVLQQEMDVINEEIYSYIAINQPLKEDIVKIASVVSFTTSMEQVARNAGEIAFVAMGYPQKLVNNRIFEACSVTVMADKTLSMVHDTLVAFGSSSHDLLSRHGDRNDEIHAMAISAMRTGLEIISDDPRDISAMEQVLMVIRALEASAMNSFIAAERIDGSITARTPGKSVECG